jgi:SIR2-like domain
VPSNLPLFEGLALDVYKVLNDDLHEVLSKARKLKTPAARKRVLEAACLSPARYVEATLFLEKQFDRFFSALEKRYDPDRKGRSKTRHVRNAVEKVLGGKSHSETHRDLLRLSIATNPTGDLSRSPSCRIVTTNFDLLFEEAWKTEFGSSAVSFDARIAPRSGAHDFAGIIHLHGSLSDDAQVANYILSSRDFARMYLRSGVIGSYIYDLIRRYILVLIGYSADDPPMRYLMDAIGEDASLYDDMKRPYAITDLSENSTEAIEQAVWSAKEITAIFFNRRAGNAFAPLWETFHKWSEWARDESSWLEAQLKMHTAGRHEDASSFQLAYVQDLLSVLTCDELAHAIRFMTGLKADFAWIDAVSAAIEATKNPLNVS